MRRLNWDRQTGTLTAIVLFGLGYCLGSLNFSDSESALAQDEKTKKKDTATESLGLSEETLAKIKAGNDAMRAAQEALVQEGNMTLSTKGVNSFAVSVGGLKTLEDLEKGIVDPETYAALYAGQATEAVAKDLKKDGDQKLTYKGVVVRVYPISTIIQLYLRKATINEEVEMEEETK